ncbi:hypothetical protein RFI_31633, partial [Reticulomyxa filosa]
LLLKNGHLTKKNKMLNCLCSSEVVIRFDFYVVSFVKDMCSDDNICYHLYINFLLFIQIKVKKFQLAFILGMSDEILEYVYVTEIQKKGKTVSHYTVRLKRKHKKRNNKSNTVIKIIANGYQIGHFGI